MNNFPRLINEQVPFYNSQSFYPSYSSPIIYEGVDVTLAKKSPDKFLDILERKIELDHEENMRKIIEEAETKIKAIGSSVANNYISRLNEYDVKNINKIQVFTEIEEKGWLFTRKRRGFEVVIERK